MSPDGTVHLTWRRDEPAAGPAVEPLLARLPDAERTAAEGMAEGRRRAFVLGRTLARAALADRLGVPARDVPLRVDDGRPHLPEPTGWHLTISHSGPVVCCAVARRPVGVDVEAPAGRVPAGSLLRRVCTAEEIALVESAADAEAAFLRLWVRKEAVSKAIGQGLDAGFRGIDVRRPLVTAAGESWEVRDVDLAGLPGAVAALGTGWELDVREVRALPDHVSGAG